MRKLSLIILLALVFMSLVKMQPTPNPHGKEFSLSCDLCHSAKGWNLDKEIYAYDHNKSQFPLTGQHQALTCRLCHPTLIFKDAGTDCVDCHTDMHAQTVGPDCQRCHTTQSWIVENTTEMHQRSRFPLVGPHYTADCGSCHKSASMLRFEPLGVACVDCHIEDYNATTAPDHKKGGYSTNCIDCHSPNSFTWSASNTDHSFFPLTGGHALPNCNSCHVNGTFTGLSKECVSCHLTDFNATTNPNHSSIGIGNACNTCHTTNPGWKPAQYTDHDARFPIYSGKHNQPAWNLCADCHPNAGNYQQFTCTTCHEHSNQGEVDGEHEGVNGYLYANTACFACHPTGSAEGGFNHNATAFPLTGAHTTVSCTNCHSSGFPGTPTACSACHITAYNSTNNPDHDGVGIPTTCADCHTTNPGWKPATYPSHNDLTGFHLTLASNCTACHSAGFTNTPTTCIGCHNNDYNQTNNPPHTTAQFPTTCEECHTQNVWVPSTFNHDGQYFPIYSGKHDNEWTLCSDCHTNASNYAVFSCIDCHEHSDQAQVNNDHQGVSGYQYNSIACYQCHPTGNSDGKLLRGINPIKGKN